MYSESRGIRFCLSFVSQRSDCLQKVFLGLGKFNFLAIIGLDLEFGSLTIWSQDKITDDSILSQAHTHTRLPEEQHPLHLAC